MLLHIQCPQTGTYHTEQCEHKLPTKPLTSYKIKENMFNVFFKKHFHHQKVQTENANGRDTYPRIERLTRHTKHILLLQHQQVSGKVQPDFKGFLITILKQANPCLRLQIKKRARKRKSSIHGLQFSELITAKYDK